MNTHKLNWVSFAALLGLVIAFPVYGMMEDQRMDQAKITLRDQYVQEGIHLYLQNCASCHGANGAGLGMMPSLNNPALSQAQPDLLFNTISRSTHGTAMAAWHIEDGGYLNDYQVKELVTLIQHTDWSVVERTAQQTGFEVPEQPAVENGLDYLSTEDADDPHQCIECHEEPVMHLDLFGINCGRCHNTQAWTPAVLTRHNFLLDHGGEGQVDCKTCHPNNYVQYECYTCHADHQPEEMATAHNAENIFEYSDCARCHPTGVADEARRLRELSPDSFETSSPAPDQKSNLNLQPGEVNLTFNQSGTHLINP